MKKYCLICIVLFINHYSISQIFSGQIVSFETRNPISYARIGILHKNKGAITDYDGNFSLDISNFSDQDTLRISAPNYESIDFLIWHCKSYFINQKSIKIELTQKVQAIEEVVVTAGKSRLLISGNNVKTPMIIAGFQNRKLGAEMGTLIKYNKKRKGQIKSLNFNIFYNEKLKNDSNVDNLEKTANDSIKFRVNLYDLKDDVPNKSILSEPIYYFDKPKNGKITIDVSELNIYIKEDCFLSVELIENQNLEGLFFKSAFLKSKSFYREAPEGDWKKVIVDLGFWAEIYYKK
jgi:hypothetical protein